MNTFQLILKNMRQRALSTCLTILSVMLGVALAIAVIIFYREGDKLFVQSDFGYNVIVGPKGDELRLVLNSVYGMGSSQGSIPWSVYDEMLHTQQRQISWAIPFMVGDTWQGKRIMATSQRLVNSPELQRFRDTLGSLTTELRTVGRPPAGEADAARAARIAKVPALLASVGQALGKVDAATLDPLDVELAERFETLRASFDRAVTMVDPAKPAMTDAAGRIAADAVDQLRLLGGFATPFEYRARTPLTLAEGRAFHARKFEGVIGASVARTLGMKIGDAFQLEHAGKAEDLHDETWSVVGILAPTGTAVDDTLYIPLTSALCVPAHEEALESMAKIAEASAPPVVEPATPTLTPTTKPADEHDHDHDHEHDHVAPARAEPATQPHADHDAHKADDHKADDHTADDHKHEADHAEPGRHADDPGHDLMAPTMTPAAGGEAGHDHHDHDHDHEATPYDMIDGKIHLHLEPEKWKVSGIFVLARDAVSVGQLHFRYMNTPMAMDVSPARQMADFFRTFLAGPSFVILALAVLVTVVAAVSILVSIYNAIAARRREIAILRALGATRQRVLSLICLEATLVGLIGGVLGLVIGHAIAGVGSSYMRQSFGQAIAYHLVSWQELAYLLGVVLIAALAGLVPAMRAYRTSVADNLAAE